MNYTIHAGNALAHEIIGLNAKIVKARDSKQEHMNGMIVNETQHCIELETKKGVKKIIKSHVILELALPSGERVQVNGQLLDVRPEDRIKVFVKKYQKYFKNWVN